MEIKIEKGCRCCVCCGAKTGQRRNGRNRSGTQTYYCNLCKKYYTVEPLTRKISDEVRKEASRLLVSGMSGRKIGQILGMSKANAYRWAAEAAKKGLN